MKNKKAERDLFILFFLFFAIAIFIIVGLVFFSLIYDLTDGFYRYDNQCFKEIVEDYCIENGMYFSYIKINIDSFGFVCQGHERGGETKSFDFLDDEISGCKK